MLGYLAGVPGRLKTLVDRLSATWAAKLDSVESRLTSTRAGYLDKLNLSGKATDDAVWTSTKAGYIDAAITGRLGSIKAIYRGTIALAAASASATATITTVVTAKSIIMPLGTNLTGAPDGGADVARIELTNSTTVTAYHRVGSPGTAITVGYQVIEFN